MVQFLEDTILTVSIRFLFCISNHRSKIFLCQRNWQNGPFLRNLNSAPYIFQFHVRATFTEVPKAPFCGLPFSSSVFGLANTAFPLIISLFSSSFFRRFPDMDPRADTIRFSHGLIDSRMLCATGSSSGYINLHYGAVSDTHDIPESAVRLS